MRVLAILALMAQPVAAECFTGQPHKVTYSDGQVMLVLDRQGDVVTHQWGDAGDVVTSHLGLFTLERRADGKVRREKWKSRLPRLADLVPGYKYDVSRMTVYASGRRAEIRLEGEVLEPATVTVGNCAYVTTVIRESYAADGEWMLTTTTYLRTDMMVVLQSETYGSGTDLMTRVATAVE